MVSGRDPERHPGTGERGRENPSAGRSFRVCHDRHGLAAEWAERRRGSSECGVEVRPPTSSMAMHTRSIAIIFSASNPFQPPRCERKSVSLSTRNFNDFGGTIGGPIRKNKTFFFAHGKPRFCHELLPRHLQSCRGANERSGDFTDRPDLAAACNPAGGVTNCLYDPLLYHRAGGKWVVSSAAVSNQVLPASRIDPPGRVLRFQLSAANF